MGRDIWLQYATNAVWYNFVSAMDLWKDIQLITGLGIIVERLDIIKWTFKQAIIEDGILHVSFRGQLNNLLHKQVIQKVICQVVKCKKAPAPWVYKAIQNMLAHAQLNMHKKIKVPGQPGINYVVDVERGHVAAANLQSLFQLNYMQNCGYNFKQLIILLCRWKLNGINLVLSIDVALSLVLLSNAP